MRDSEQKYNILRRKAVDDRAIIQSNTRKAQKSWIHETGVIIIKKQKTKKTDEIENKARHYRHAV